MNKNNFINILDSSLGNLSPEEKRDILYDYEEHFLIGAENGKTEDQIISELGDPKVIAKHYKANINLEKAKLEPSTRNMFNAVLAAVSLGFFNLVLVLGPFLGLVAVIIALFAAAAALSISGLALFFSIFFLQYAPWIINIPINANPHSLIFFGTGTTCLGILFFIGDCYIAKYFYNGTVKYLKWNLNIIKK